MANLSITRLSSNVTGTIANALPKMSVAGKKSNKAIAWIGKNISSPQNRLILGVSALMSQPYMDVG